MNVLSLSYGKDSLACLGAIEKLNLQLDRIVHCEVMATNSIPADLPSMMEFKKKADKIIKDRWGITVEHITADVCYEDVFYRYNKNKSHIYGFPCIKGAWCNSRLKVHVLNKALKGADCVYIGIAIDEPNRLKRLSGNRISPLFLAEWTEKIVIFGVKITIYSPQYILLLPVVDVGSVIINLLTNSDYYAKITLITGNYYLNGTKIVLLNSNRPILYKNLRSVSVLKMRESLTLTNVSTGIVLKMECS